jgi:multicomponent Na+:H+ antiporter subunit A
MVLLAVYTPGDSLLIRDVMAALPGSPVRALALWFLVGGFCLKVGIFPLHVWMPLAYSAAPIPASAVLSGAVVKVGLIGLIRFLPFDIPLPGWGEALATAGLFSAFYGVVIGILQRDPKAVLAYSSVSQMGLVVAVLGMGLAAGRSTAPLAAVFYASHHVLVKGALFLAVGVAAASGRNILRLVLVPAAVLALGLGGLPLTGGALTKYAIKGPLGDGLAGTLSLASAAGTTLLMLHFLRCLKAHGAKQPGARAGIGLKAPWLVLGVAALAVPWTLYLGIAVPRGLLPSVMTPAAMWGALWPVLTGVALAAGLWRWGDRLPRVPAGDIAVFIDMLARAAPRWGALVERADEFVRRWPVAVASLLAIAIALGAAMWTRS